MFLYVLGIITLFSILGLAGCSVIAASQKEGLLRDNEYKVLENPDTVVDELINELIKIDKGHENEKLLESRKSEILNTFIELHRSGSFCSHLTQDEVIHFVKHKLNSGDENGL